MDWAAQKNQLSDFFRKYRSVLLIAIIGVMLMILPEKSPDVLSQKTETKVQETDLEKSLVDILSQVSGAGKVDVLLAQIEGEETIYQCDENTNNENIDRDTVLVTNGTREETGLIRQVLSPVYRGAVIVCQGGDNSGVRLAIVEAVKSVTGLTSDRITVLKMK